MDYFHGVIPNNTVRQQRVIFGFCRVVAGSQSWTAAAKSYERRATNRLWTAVSTCTQRLIIEFSFWMCHESCGPKQRQRMKELIAFFYILLACGVAEKADLLAGRVETVRSGGWRASVSLAANEPTP